MPFCSCSQVFCSEISKDPDRQQIGVIIYNVPIITLEPGVNKVNKTQSSSQVAYSLVEKTYSNDAKKDILMVLQH